MEKISFKEKIQYKFENIISSGPLAMIGFLAILSGIIVVVAGVIISLFGIPNSEGEQMSLLESVWQSFMRAVDAGALGADNGWALRLIMLIVTIGGLFILAALIGILTSGLENKLDELRKGKSKVLESDHTLILGFNAKIFTIVQELIIANENQNYAKIVILADEDKVEMEDKIREKITDFKTTQVIVRSGSPSDISSIHICNPYEAKSIVVLSPEQVNNPDTHVIKSVLALTNNKNRKKGKYHIVAEITETANIEAATLVGGDEAKYIFTERFVSRLTAQICRQSGLSLVFDELLQFEGDEIYFQHEPKLTGRKFGEVLLQYRNSSIIGIHTKGGDILINPPMDTVFNMDDEVIAISEDDDTIILEDNIDFKIDENYFAVSEKTEQNNERTLILGWNEKGKRIIKELDDFLIPGSETLVVSISGQTEEDLKILQEKVSNQALEHVYGDIGSRATLNNLELENFDHIIVLSYTDGMDIEDSDAKTLICLLHLRTISEQMGKSFNIVSEMRDIRNKELAEVAQADDFIVSDQVISRMLAQMSENSLLKKVYDILFQSEGSEIYLRPIKNYIQLDTEVNFYNLVASAQTRNEIAIGYRLAEEFNNSNANYGVYVNPDKLEKIKFSEGDMLIVLAED
jgi:Trk K+ transport system NAD-binding subunit